MAKVKHNETLESQRTHREKETPSNDDQNTPRAVNQSVGERSYPRKSIKRISKLKALRKAEGLTLEHLSSLTNISPSYLSRLEAGDRRLNTDLIQRLAAVFRCSPADLLQSEAWEGQPAPHVSAEKGLKVFLPQKDLPIYKIGSEQELGNIPLSIGGEVFPVQFLNDDTPIDWGYRPVQLSQVPTAFAVYLSDSHFSPKYEEGELLLIHPSKPLSRQCSILAVHQDCSVMLGQFEGWRDNSLHMRPYRITSNQSEALSLDKKSLKAVYRIIGTLESA